ncbi:ABC transporter ATP-binding protein [Maridesulfovibrio sp. FT414]|uniref:ABC transporter ATP-binding protein n=1 Tax=Maridesulfovibrio sp. FT414 TaxID=2979469 RepID=UPI003D800FA7
MASVVLHDIGKSFGEAAACSKINLNIESGEFFTFLGPSGCGKTTILRLIAGFLNPDEGTILIDGKDITHLAPEKRKVGMVFQNYALFPHLSVYGNIAYGLGIGGRSAAEIRSTTDRYMEMVGLADYGDRRVSELSGGEQQRVALARSLAVEPQVLLLDEPLSNLDARLREKMRSEIRSLQKRLGITTVFVTHDQTEALTLSDRIAVFERGRVAQVGTPRQVYSDPASSFVAGFVGETNLLKAEFLERLVANDSERGETFPGSRYGAGFVSIRPQDIVLSNERPALQDHLSGVVEDVQHNGVWINYAVRVGEACFRVAGLNSFSRDVFDTGDHVFLAFDHKAVKMLQS